MAGLRSRVLAVAAAILAVLAVQVSAVTAASALPATAQIAGGGSTWAENAINQWVADVSTQGLQVVYTGTGSAQGRLDFAHSTVDWAASDVAYQGGTDSSARPYAYLPIAGGATAFMYQLRVNGSLVRNLRLSGLTLAKIFTNQITNWDDPAITADNDGVQLPSIPIIPVVHSEAAGTTYQFTSYLSSQFPAVWQSFSGTSSPTMYFPAQGAQVAQNGSDGVASYVTATADNGAIGYDEYSYALQKGFPAVSVENAAGYFSPPTALNVAVALSQVQIDQNPSSPTYLQQDPSAAYTSTDPRTYPLSSYAYMIIPTSGTDPRMTTAKRQALADYIYYGVCQGQNEVSAVGYAPLPLNLVQSALQEMGQLHSADPGVDLTGLTLGSCTNPTFQDSNPSPAYLDSTAPMPPACAQAGQGPCPALASIGTSVALAGPVTTIGPVTVTMTIGEADAPNTDGLAGTIQLSDGQILATIPTVRNQTVYTAQVTLPDPGDNRLVAEFAPSQPYYVPSQQAIQIYACTACRDAQDVETTINPGSLTITTAFTSTNPFTLPDLQLNATGTLLVSSARIPAAGDSPIVVQSSLAGNPNWTISVSVSDLTCASGSCLTPVPGEYQSINGQNLGLTAGSSDTPLPSAQFPGAVTFTDSPAAAGAGPGDPGSAGLKDGPHTFAASDSGGNGSVSLHGTLTIQAPTATQAGTYTGTITLTVG